MALEARYTEQMPFVGTKTQRRKIAEAAAGGRSMADVIREAVDKHFGLVDGEETSE